MNVISLLYVLDVVNVRCWLVNDKISEKNGRFQQTPTFICLVLFYGYQWSVNIECLLIGIEI